MRGYDGRMRIMQVTAHYPPDFVSGGSLIPQQCAEAMMARGHESFVFAGDLNRLAPLAESDSLEDGIPVRWIGISSFLSWADEKNFNNPAVATAFARYLDEVHPDIVHIHNLQTLGAGIIEEAAKRGVRVIVTMHDFWWVCSRQFLVDQDMQPCSLVVSCGSCDCAVSKTWLEKRTAWLFDRLQMCDLILVPSYSMGQALIANGIDPDRVRVNENGVELGSSHERSRPDRVRFLYAGGPSPVKGFDTLAQAWADAGVDATLDVYGADLDLPGVTSHPPFAADEKGEIFASHDVLILPSLARESHSILTREALASGMTAIVSDTLGPEEAVTNGANGLVVGAGDVGQLAAAITQLSDPDRAYGLMGKGSASPVISPEAAMTQLETYYLGDRVRDPVRDAVRNLISDVVIVIGIQSAPARYRAHLPAEALRARGLHVTILNYRDPALSRTALDADAVVFYRVPATFQILELIDQLRSAPRIIPILGDVDDLIFDPDIEPYLDNLSTLSTEERDLWRQGIHRYRTTLEACDAFIGSTATVSREGAHLMDMPAHSYANGVGGLIARVSEAELLRPRKSGPPRIGFFSGTKTHDADWTSIEPAIAEVLQARPEVELWLGGLVEPTEILDPFRDRIVRLPLVAWHELPAYLRDIDVNLAPLTSSVFNEAKSAIKWLEAALVHTPTVASPTQPFKKVIQPGTGLLASTHDEWVEAIGQLLDDPMVAEAMGREAQRFALINLSPGVQGKIYEDILIDTWMRVAEQGHRSGSTFPQVAIDEPPTPLATDIEPYGLPGTISSPSPVRRAASKVRRSLQADGLGATVRKIVARIR